MRATAYAFDNTPTSSTLFALHAPCTAQMDAISTHALAVPGFLAYFIPNLDHDQFYFFSRNATKYEFNDEPSEHHALALALQGAMPGLPKSVEPHVCMQTPLCPSP